MKVELRDYQKEAVEQARAAIRAGAKNVLICAPTGAGKTVIGSHLISEAEGKGKRSCFVIDRLSLLNQTSETFDRYGIDHGIIQSQHWRFRPSKLVQICSIQTVARRDWPETSLILVDEAHTITETVKKRIEKRDCITIGLTATPFTKGLGKLYDAIINVTTTNALIEQGFLSRYRIFACVEPDMEGVKVVAGEWESKAAQDRALQVVGDVVQEYLTHGEGRKFICSAVDTAHVEELQRQFQAAGINCATYTYRDKEEDRDDTVREYRKPDSTIRGLITVTAASKGFDVADIGCVIMARPLRKSLAEHIQFLGRGLRIAEGKTDCIVLDHSGNCKRFWKETNEFFENGVTELDDGKKKEKPKAKEQPEKEPMKCPSCRAMHMPAPYCPCCGHQYPKKAAIEHVPGTLKELLASGSPKQITTSVWPMVCHYARQGQAPADRQRAKALALYKRMTGQWPKAEFDQTTPVPPTPEVASKIRSLNIAWAKSREKQQREAVPA